MNIKGMFRCNSCYSGRCSKATFKMYENKGDSSKCQLYDKAPTLKVPLLVLALANTKNAGPIADLLDKFGYSVQERIGYPYFEFKRKSNG